MKLKHQISISLRDFILEGKFDYLSLGDERDWILHNFPDPDEWSAGKLEKASIWRYGTLELHFNDDLLSMIYTDDMADLDGTPSLDLDPWILSEGHIPKFAEVLHKLNREGADYSVRNQVWEGRSEIQILKSHVQLSFDALENDVRHPEHFDLVSICLQS